MNQRTAKLVIARTREGIVTLSHPTLLALVDRHDGQTNSAEFMNGWDSICEQMFGERYAFIGTTYAD